MIRHIIDPRHPPASQNFEKLKLTMSLQSSIPHAQVAMQNLSDDNLPLSIQSDVVGNSVFALSVRVALELCNSDTSMQFFH